MNIEKKLHSKEFKDFLIKKINTLSKIKFVFDNSLLTGGAFTSYCLEFLYGEKTTINDYDFFIDQSNISNSDLIRIKKNYPELNQEIFVSTKNDMGNEPYVMEHAHYQIVESFDYKKMNYIFFTTEKDMFTPVNLIDSFDLNCIRGAYCLSTTELYLPEDFIKFLYSKKINFSELSYNMKNNLLSQDEDNGFWTYEDSKFYLSSLIRAIDKKNRYNWNFDSSFFLEELALFSITNKIAGFQLDKDIQGYYHVEGESSNIHCFVTQKIKKQFIEQKDIWNEFFEIKNIFEISPREDKFNEISECILSFREEIKEYTKKNNIERTGYYNFVNFLLINYFYYDKVEDRFIKNIKYFTNKEKIDSLKFSFHFFQDSYWSRSKADYFHFKDYDLSFLKEFIEIFKEFNYEKMNIKIHGSGNRCLPSIFNCYLIETTSQDFNKLDEKEINKLSYNEYEKYLIKTKDISKEAYLAYVKKVKDIFLLYYKNKIDIPYIKYLRDSIMIITKTENIYYENVYRKYKEIINSYLQSETNLLEYNKLDASEFEEFFNKIVQLNNVIEMKDSKKTEFLIKCLF